MVIRPGIVMGITLPPGYAGWPLRVAVARLRGLLRAAGLRVAVAGLALGRLRRAVPGCWPCGC